MTGSACSIVSILLCILVAAAYFLNQPTEVQQNNLQQTMTTNLPLEKNLAIGITGSYNSVSNIYFSLLDLKIGVLPSSQLNGQNVQFSLNLTDDRILIVNSSTDISGFGIPCTPENQCYAPTSYPDICEFNHAAYNCQNATSLLRFKEQSLPDGFTTTGEPFQLVEPIQDLTAT
jgi:hypothetical protein